MRRREAPRRSLRIMTGHLGENTCVTAAETQTQKTDVGGARPRCAFFTVPVPSLLRAITIAAIYRTVTLWLEREGRGHAAFRTDGLERLPLRPGASSSASGGTSLASRRVEPAASPIRPRLALLATRAAALRIAGKAALGVPGLVFCGVDEFLTAITAFNVFVLERHQCLPPMF